MDYQAIIDRGALLREVYPELQALFPSAPALAKALNLVLSPLEGGEAGQRAEALRQPWRSLNAVTDNTQRRRLIAEKKAARAKYLEIAETNKQNNRWCYGGRLSRKQRDFLWQHIHKLRSLKFPASWEVCELMTGYTTKGAKDGYERWKARQSPESLAALSHEAEQTYMDDWNLFVESPDSDAELPDDNDRPTHWNAPLGESDAPDEWVLGKDYPYPCVYKANVLKFLQTKEGAEFEEPIVRLEIMARKMQELAVAKQVKVGIKWSQCSWDMNDHEDYPTTSDNAFKHVKSLRVGHKNSLARQIDDAVVKLRSAVPDSDFAGVLNDLADAVGKGILSSSYSPKRPRQEETAEMDIPSPPAKTPRTASATVSTTPAKTPSVTPAKTPSATPATAAPTTPAMTASTTPAMTASTTPAVTASPLSFLEPASTTPAKTASATPAKTPSATTSTTASATAPATASATASASASPTPAKTPSATTSATAPATASATASASASPTPAKTATVTEDPVEKISVDDALAQLKVKGHFPKYVQQISREDIMRL
ncbi:unnamed protein product [Phytophthora lilii]|uniref:Unnamed protein product n=1 Tax=Phytophthora lilii TaxID=2077276 RepID=A0A9W6TG01_9STRA|nr:unnamed protein product [Phytophthora lilii]